VVTPEGFRGPFFKQNSGPKPRQEARWSHHLLGDIIVERLEAFDNAARSYTYTILQAPFPVTGYRSTLRVREVNGGTASRVEWSGEFTPSGVSDREAARQFQGVYEDGLKALATRFAPRAQEVTP
jgi:hypothetical protein